MAPRGSTDKVRVHRLEGFLELIKWVKLNDNRHPREVNPSTHGVDKQERKFARVLRLCRERDKQGKLPEDAVRQLDEVLPTWRDGGRQPAAELCKLKREVQGLVKWCDEHNERRLVTGRTSDGICTKPSERAACYIMLNRVRRLASGPHAAKYAEAFAILDHSYPGWRGEKRGSGPRASKTAARPSASALHGQDTTAQGCVDMDMAEEGQEEGEWSEEEEEGEDNEEEEEADGEADDEADGGDMKVDEPAQQAMTYVTDKLRGLRGVGRPSGGARSLRPGRVVSACRSQVDPLLRKGFNVELRFPRETSAQTSFVPDELSIESTGFVEGAVWVLRLVNVQDWPVAITTPTPTTSRQTRSAAIAGGAAPDPFTNSAVKAEYKGYKRWREELQWGVFMIVCLRCHPDDVKALKTQRQVTQTLQHADFSKQVCEALRGRVRRPVVALEFPLVGGADLNKVQDAKTQLLQRLHISLGRSDEPAEAPSPLALSSVVEVEGLEVVRPITSDNATQQRPFAIRDAGPRTAGVFGLSVTTIGDKTTTHGSTLAPIFVRHRMRNRDGRLDTIQTLGNLDESVRDAGLVALSFLRAHTTWIGQRYQLYTNPRRRRHRDWMLGFLSVADEISGTSIGAALAVTLASYFFSGGVPENVYITGTASISGVMGAVQSYQAKLGAALRDSKARPGTPHLLVPRQSVLNGVLADSETKVLAENADGTEVNVTSYCQVWLPEAGVERVRVLAPKDLFECIGLCLNPPGMELLARPTDPVPGLVVVKTLHTDEALPDVGYVGLAECYAYVGSGELVATASAPGLKRVVALGLFWVRNYWKRLSKEFQKRLRCRFSGVTRRFDVHGHAVHPIGGMADGHCAGGVALAFLSLCVGKQLPSTLGLLCGISMDGHVMGEALTRGCLKAAREHGITTILASAMQRGPSEAVLGQCSAEDKAGLTVEYLSDGKELLDRLLRHGTDLPRMPMKAPKVHCASSEDEKGVHDTEDDETSDDSRAVSDDEASS